MWCIDPGEWCYYVAYRSRRMVLLCGVYIQEWCYYVAYRFRSGVIMWRIDSGVVFLCGV